MYWYVQCSRIIELRETEIALKETEIASKKIEALKQQRTNLEGAVKKIIEDCTQKWDDKFDINAARSVMCSSSIFFA